MNLTKITLLSTFAFALLLNSASAQIITPYSTFQGWLPVLSVALLLSMMIAAGIYILGSILNDHRLKSRGLNEIGQVIGTAALTVIIITIFLFIGSATDAAFAATPIGTNLNNICTGNLANTHLPLIDSTLNPFATYQICSMEVTATSNAQSRTGLADITPYIDYNLAATYVITANVVNQSVNNLNGTYTYESLVGFLGTLKSTTQVCELGPECIIPISPKLFDVVGTFIPLEGYSMLRAVTSTVETQSIFIYYMFVIQLIFFMLILYAWPWLLAAGLILRSLVITRKLGGLLVAIVVVAVVLYPMAFLIEYVTLSGGGSATLSPIGANPTTLPDIPLIGKDLNTNAPIYYNTKTINFFVFPSIPAILYNDGCWPTTYDPFTNTRSPAPVANEELEDAAFYLVPGIGLGSGLLGGFTGTIPPVPTECTPSAAIKSVMDLTNVYGLVSVTGYVIPLLNILIALAALKGISGLLGGDVELAGIGRLI